MSSVRRISNSRVVLRILYYSWIVFPYVIRKPLTAYGIWWILLMKKVSGVNRDNEPTPFDDLGNLSFWGVPSIPTDSYTLDIGGQVENPVRLTYDDLTRMDVVERSIRMDCVGGFRNNTVMKGVPISRLLELAKIKSDARSVLFVSADGYHTTHLVSDLLESDAFMAYELNGQRIERFGHPLRLVAPGTYGYKWAKWVVRIDLLRNFPAGYWERLGLPRRGKVGDIW